MAKNSILFIFILGFLMACSTSAVETPDSIAFPTEAVVERPSETSAQTEIVLPTLTATIQPTETQTPIPSPTLTPTDLPFVEIHQQCLEVREDFQPGMMTEGNLIFLSEVYYAEDGEAPDGENGIEKLTPLGREPFPEFGVFFPFAESFSPDKKYLASVDYDETELSILNALGVTSIVVPWDGQWKSIWGSKNFPRWFGEHQLIFSADVQKSGSVILLNTSTGDSLQKDIHFPNIYNPTMETTWFVDTWGNPTYVEFNKTFTSAAYLYRLPTERGLVLWDLEADTEVRRWTSPDQLDLSHPVWSPDGTSMIAALPAKSENYSYYYDLFHITQTGQSTRLTNFEEYYRDWAIIFGNMIWSPDGQYLAFDLNYDLNENKTKLLLYVPSMNNILDLCLQTGTDMFSYLDLVWSPNGQQFVVNTYSSEGYVYVLVDLVESYAVKIDEIINVVGWMADE